MKHLKSGFFLLLILVFQSPGAFGFERSMLALDTSSGKHVFTIEIANTMERRSLGLMHRESMPRNHGMLFVFEGDAVRRMWMENTIIPLDMLFADSTGKIVHIARMTEPFSRKTISSGVEARYVLEINGGLSDELGLDVGDRLESPILQQ